MLIDKFDFGQVKHLSDAQEQLHSQFVEMGQLKSDFDIEKYTVKKEGNFLAHQFHFLMRQYSLALAEANRMLIDHEEFVRNIDALEKRLAAGEKTYVDKDGVTKYIDLEIKRQINNLKLNEITATNTLCSINTYEKMRTKLIENNGGKMFTNEDHQREEPAYWKWFLEQRAYDQTRARLSGVNEGVWEAIGQLESAPVINPAYQIGVLDNGKLDIKRIEEEDALGKKNNQILIT